MVEAIGFMNSEMEKIGLDYEFDEWTSDPIPSVYWVGEYNEAGAADDGSDETSFILTGTTTESRLVLEIQKDMIKKHFNKLTAILDSCSGIAVDYNNAFGVPTGAEGIKRVQINLTIKEWTVTE